MNKITEPAIEEFAIELLDNLGYEYIYAPDIAPDSDNPKRNSFEEVLLPESLISAINRINPKIPIAAREDAYKQVERIQSPELIPNNETFHRL